MNIEWEMKKFSELSTTQLYEILQLRSEVFVVEQNCIYQDLDGVDFKSEHLCGRSNGILVAYMRIVEPGVKYNERSIGRVITRGSARKSGLGKVLMQRALSHFEKNYPDAEIRISAQSYLKNFYASFGFDALGKEYLEDDIPHTEMLRRVR